jgi:hypothetical protein
MQEVPGKAPEAEALRAKKNKHKECDERCEGFVAKM